MDNLLTPIGKILPMSLYLIILIAQVLLVNYETSSADLSWFIFKVSVISTFSFCTKGILIWKYELNMQVAEVNIQQHATCSR